MKPVPVDKLGEVITEALVKAIKDTGNWESFDLNLQFYGRKDGDEVSIANVVLSPAEDKVTTKSKRKRENPERFLEELKKL